ncbi:PLD nuclease N-terminal domain-containing protein [Nocardiopsis salina]|uniref:PLD nuclease N-terminal domain-containing protein n=1 Tax=Nocardiopsis salina TaxID=245836 RepID=UPI0003475256|nr:PLD nuclease N-terminal domain-containing protein [Nocardiopsis salina]
MLWLGGLITFATIVLWVYAFFDALTTPTREIRNLPKILWMVVIVLFPAVGAILWLFLGRPPRSEPAQGGEPAQSDLGRSADDLDPSDFARPSDPSRPLGPDDDPEFLRNLDRRIDPDE